MEPKEVFALLEAATNGQVKIEVRGKDTLVITLANHGQESSGELVLEESPYGWYVFRPGLHDDPIALLDTYYQSDACKSEGDGEGWEMGIEIFSPAEAEDPVGMVRYRKKFAQITLDPTMKLFEMPVEWKEWPTYRIPPA